METETYLKYDQQMKHFPNEEIKGLTFLIVCLPRTDSTNDDFEKLIL